MAALDAEPTLRSLVAGPINILAIEEHWDEVFWPVASIQAGTVNASTMLRKQVGYPRQELVARALREIGQVERTLFMLVWFADSEQRRRTGSILDKGEPRTRSPAPASSTALASFVLLPP